MGSDIALQAPSVESAGGPRGHSYGMLFLASFVALYFELLVIRYVCSELQVFASLKNLPLIASFFGIGIGMMRWEALKTARAAFVFVSIALFTLARFGARLTQPGMGWRYEIGLAGHHIHLISFAAYLAEVLIVLWLTVIFFVTLGSLIGKYFQMESPLAAYGLNLAGSLAGMLAFTLLSFLSTPPSVWLLFGFGLISVFYWRRWGHLAAFAALVGVTAIPQPQTYWSPYHRIDVFPIQASNSSKPSAYDLWYDHMLYQTMVDLSPESVQEHPNAEPNRSVRLYYEQPYLFESSPHDVLIVGAGTGNDVAAALRHGAEHVDAVEIDPVILELGRKFHPEQPYSSPKVVEHADDARAYFQKCKQKYDLIVFGFLDSSTLLASASSIRLDNYVYTKESFEAARKLLKPDGTLILSFAVGDKSFVADRLFATLTEAFGVEPRAFPVHTSIDGTLFVEGAARSRSIASDVPEATAELSLSSRNSPAATDDWPFLYLYEKSIPPTLGIAMLIFVASLWFWQSGKVQQELPDNAAQFFLLGVGFLLLETRAVTQLALLFGSTWVVVAVVITVFLVMALAANAFAMQIDVSIRACYGAVLLLIVAGMVLPYSRLVGMPLVVKVLAAALTAALPVFFSGLVFSSILKRSTAPSAALGMNLLGAVIGGVLENSVMLGGIELVGGLALVAYAGAWICSRRTPQRLSVVAQTK
jgi:spermidine synthase